MLRLTNSEMSTWRDCHRKWYLSHYLGLRRRSSPLAGHPLTIGTAVHDSLAAYYDPEQNADPVAHANGCYDEKVALNPTSEVALEKERKLVTIMLEGYVEWLEETGNDADLRVIGTEKFLEVPMIEGVTLLSKLDARVERISTGARLALEHKTTGSLKVALPLLQLDTQLLTEHLVEFLDLKAHGKESDRAQGVLYNMLRKVKRTHTANPPFYGREEVTHNVHELRAHWFHVVSIAKDILSATARLDAGESHQSVTPPSPHKDCSWKCSFFLVCPMHDDGSDVAGILDDLYVVGDPLERYDDSTPYEDE